MTMRHNLKAAYRNFRRYKSSFFINLIGLTCGLACTILIYLWVYDELHVDKFHEKGSRLHQVMRNEQTATGILTFEGVPGLLSASLTEEMPEIEYGVSVVPPQITPKIILSVGTEHFKTNPQFAGEDFFNVFSYSLLRGDKDQVLKDKSSVVISDALAMKLFNTTEGLIGNMVLCNDRDFGGAYQISGIFKRTPPNSSAQFDLLFNYELFLEKRPALLSWSNSNPRVYLVLKEGTNTDDFAQKIAGFIKRKQTDLTSTLFLRRYSEKYLYGQYENGMQTVGRIVYVKLFSAVALFILAMACINFINLSTAMASRRLKEVGIKKTVGASRRALITQYMVESMLLAFLSMLLAILVVALLLPQFNLITGKSLTLGLHANLVVSVLTITLLTGLIAGSYPAFYVSGFKPAVILKGRISASAGEFWARKGLSVFQYTISVILIVSVLVVYGQMEFVQSKNLGYDKDNVIYFEKDGRLQEDLEAFLAELKNIPGVLNASSMGYDIKGGYGFTSGVSWNGKNPDEKIDFGNLEINYDLIETLGIEVKHGRSYSRSFGTDNSAIIFNEAAIESMGLEDPIGKIVKLWGGNREIIGIVKNIHYESLHERVKPCFFQLNQNSKNIVVKIRAGSEKETIGRLQKFYSEYNPGFPFDFKFLDENYEALYIAEARVAVLSRYFTAIALIISCLGLFGLATFTAERRLKEISIRKVLGSDNTDIVLLLSGEFTKVVLVGIAIALPVSYYAANSWLNGFAYRIDLKLWYFCSAGLLALLLVWLTVGVQMIKAARINLVQSLRTNE